MARKILAGLAAAIIGALVVGLLAKFLWNETIAATFGVATVSFWQAVGLFILAKLCFGFGGSTRRLDRTHRRGRAPAAAVQHADITALADDETFKTYWQTEGRSAYEAFRASGTAGNTSD
jgi:hypothetical protein